MRWTLHLARQYPSRLVFLIGVTTFASVLAYSAIGSLGLVAVVAVMVASTADFLFPVTFVLTRESAVCRTLFKQSEIRWENVRRCYLDDFGVKLSPLDRQSRLEAFRGVYLRYAGNQEQVVEAVKSLRGTRGQEC